MDSIARPRRPASFWIAIVLALILMGSCLVTVVALGVAVMATQRGEQKTFNEQYVLGKRSADDKVLDIQLEGVISDVDVSTALGRTPNPVATIISELQQARQDTHVKAVLLEVDSPGGGVTASDVLYHALDTFRKDRNVPVVVLCGDVTASGGYYVSMAANHIMAHATSVVGSIGVIAELTNVQSLMQKIGVRMSVIKSRRADGSESFKDIGSPFRPMKPAERALMQAIIQDMWARFVDVVSNGRNGKLTHTQVANLADGRIWTAQQALELKLIDSLGYREDAFKKAAELAHLSSTDVKLVSYHRTSSLIGDLLGSQVPSQGLQTLAETLDPMNRSTPRLMYLWTVR